SGVHILSIFALAASACAAAPRPAQSATAAVTCAGSTIRSAEQAATYSQCTAVTGDLRITGTPLADLTAFRSILRISGTLEISGNSQLDDLDGLESLSSVGDLDISNNPELDALQDLEDLHSVRKLTIRDNPELSSLDGLQGVQQAEQVQLERNGLFDVNGLSGLERVGDLSVVGHRKLISLRGLSNLTAAHSVRIQNNPVVCACFGLLPALHSVQNIVVRSNQGLKGSEVRELVARAELPFQKRDNTAAFAGYSAQR
ncbi:MAG TPA: hypothetical protein VNG33_10380, partial [Polyangiaceae bacterium]|nr:hypothetical protein [Polyangiaceae bacterium]